MDAKQDSLLSQLALLAVNVIATTRSTLAALERVSLLHFHGECSKTCSKLLDRSETGIETR